MTERLRSQAVVIGIGNESRGDDTAGLLVARRIAELAPGTHVVEARDDVACLEALRNAGRAIVIDATQSGVAAGTVRRVDARREALPAEAVASSHRLGLAMVLRLADALGGCARGVIVYGIEGTDFATGAPPSPEVREAVERVAQAVLTELPGISGYVEAGTCTN